MTSKSKKSYNDKHGDYQNVSVHKGLSQKVYKIPFVQSALKKKVKKNLIINAALEMILDKPKLFEKYYNTAIDKKSNEPKQRQIARLQQQIAEIQAGMIDVSK